MQRWLFVSLGLAIALAAFYLLVVAGPPPLDHIDDSSRAQLDRVLRDAERGKAR